MNHLFQHIQGHISGAFRPWLLPTGGATAFSPASLFANSELGGDFTQISLTNAFSDTAGTTAATVNGSAASVRSLAGTVSIVTQATGASQPILRGTPTGANLAAADGNFFTPGNWTAGAGWAISDAVATATTSSAALDLAGLTATTSKVYLIRYYVTRSAGSVTLNFGGVAATARTATGLYEDYITATGTGALSFTTSGFTGTVTQIQIWDASADAVTAPYFLWFNGTSSKLTASYSQTAYPLTLATVARIDDVTASNGGVLSIIEAVGSYKAGTRTASVDRGTGILTNTYNSTDFPSGVLGVTFSEFETSTYNTTVDHIPWSPASTNTNTFGTKATICVGSANNSSIHCRGAIYGWFWINRMLTATEKQNLSDYMRGDLAIQCAGDSLTAGSGVAIARSYPARLRLHAARQVKIAGYPGATGPYIRDQFVLLNDNRRRWINVIWVGTNDDWNANGLDPTKAAISDMIAYLQGDARYIVMNPNMFEGGSKSAALYTEMDAYLLATYGARFLDIRAYLQSKNDGSGNDLADIAGGLVPRSLRSDTIHLNDTGYQHVAEAVHARLGGLGWLE